MTITFDGGFENGQVYNDGGLADTWMHHQFNHTPDRITLVTDIVRKGTYAARVEVRPTDVIAGGVRSEILYMTQADGTHQTEDLTSGTKYYSISVYLPSDYTVPVHPEMGLFFQLHAPDNYSYFGLGLRVSDKFFASICGGETTSPTITTATFSDEGLNIGHWSDFIIKIKFSVDTSGEFQVWRRNEDDLKFASVYSANIPTLQYKADEGSDPGPHYWKTGYYIGPDQTENHVIYLDCHRRSTTYDEAEAAFPGVNSMSKAFGVQNPTSGEDPVSWQTWSDGAGNPPSVSGDSDWGKLRLDLAGAEGRSAVYDLGSSHARTFTLTENVYGTGAESAVLQIRGHDTTAFLQDDASPAWENYNVPVSKTWRYIQIREITSVPQTVYYVDSGAAGDDSRTAAQAKNPATPVKTVNKVMTFHPLAGEKVCFKGNFTQTIWPNENGAVLYEAENITQVDDSVVTFSHNINGINPNTDFVCVYNSRAGNSGCFAVVSVSGDEVTVDTQFLPGGTFLLETSTDPHFLTGPLQAAIIRPVHFTAWDTDDPPVFTTAYQVYKNTAYSAVLCSYLKSDAGFDYGVWPAYEIVSSETPLTHTDYVILDHLEIMYSESAIAVGGHGTENYCILQHNNIHDVGLGGNGIMDEIVYLGNWGRPDLQTDFIQVMYNVVGPHRDDTCRGDGVNCKASCHNPTIFGNEINGIRGNSGDTPITMEAIDVYISNNYVHDNYCPGYEGSGIVCADGTFDIWTHTHVIVCNNIVANIAGAGIVLMDIDNSLVYNNTVYNIEASLDPETEPLHCKGINVWAWQTNPHNNIVMNNIVHTCAGYGMGSDYGGASYISDYNIVYNATKGAYNGITPGAHDLEADPGLIDPANGDFSIGAGSACNGSGTDLSSVFKIDKHNADAPGVLAAIQNRVRSGAWCRGAYQYVA